MTDRAKIFQALAGTEHAPEEVPGFAHEAVPDALQGPFCDAARAAGAEVVTENVSQVLEALCASARNVVDTRTDPGPVLPDSVDLAIIEGIFGVAENGAVWVDPQERYARSLLTLATHIVLVVPADGLVATMHEAYARIDFARLSYALFLSGPSKTADIEQSLVIGAHGAMRMTVLLA